VWAEKNTCATFSIVMVRAPAPAAAATTTASDLFARRAVVGRGRPGRARASVVGRAGTLALLVVATIAAIVLFFFAILAVSARRPAVAIAAARAVPLAAALPAGFGR